VTKTPVQVVANVLASVADALDSIIGLPSSDANRHLENHLWLTSLDLLVGSGQFLSQEVREAVRFQVDIVDIEHVRVTPCSISSALLLMGKLPDVGDVLAKTVRTLNPDGGWIDAYDVDPVWIRITHTPPGEWSVEIRPVHPVEYVSISLNAADC